jgi:hypothetical protein
MARLSGANYSLSGKFQIERRRTDRLHTTKTVGLPHAREHGEHYDGVA